MASEMGTPESKALIEKYISKLNIVDETVFEKYGEMPLVELDLFTFKKGKYENATFLDTYTNQHNYVQWVLNNKKQISEKSTLFLFRAYVVRKINE